MNSGSQRRTARAAGAIGLAVAVAVSACGSDDAGSGGASDPSSAAAIPDDADFNAADVAFATDMLQHHAQALAMVDITTDRPMDQEFSALAEQIRGEQAPEIETMADWLHEWGQPVPATVNDHANAEGHSGSDTSSEGMGMDMPGMMSDQEMTDLEQSSDADFEAAWLEMMVAHHQGAVTMAQTELDDGEDPDALELARQIVSSQGGEIDQMKAMLGD